MNQIYTGIGSRETPKDILGVMIKLGYILSQADWTLRSGHAPGADYAFEWGALSAGKQPKMEIYLPWSNFEGSTISRTLGSSYLVPSEDCKDTYEEAMRVAANFHPTWDKCSEGAKKLHTRNVYQVAGRDLSTASDFVVCWTKDGKRGGGTGQALRMAEYLKIPIFDLAVCSGQDVIDFINRNTP